MPPDPTAPRAATCALCGAAVERSVDFYVQVKSVGVDTGGSVRRWLNVRCDACESCHGELRRFRVTRVALGLGSIALLVAWLPLAQALEGLGAGPAVAGLAALAVVAAPAIAVFSWIATRGNGLLARMKSRGALEALRDQIPEVGGVLRWREARLHLSVPKDQPVIDLAAVPHIVGASAGRKSGAADAADDRAERIRAWKERQRKDG